MRRVPFKRLAIAGVLVIALVVGGLVWQRSRQGTQSSTVSKNPNAKAGQQAQAQEQAPNPKRIRLIAAGDFIAHDSVNNAAKCG
jgi:hypothetical protein